MSPEAASGNDSSARLIQTYLYNPGFVDSLVARHPVGNVRVKASSEIAALGQDSSHQLVDGLLGLLKQESIAFAVSKQVDRSVDVRDAALALLKMVDLQNLNPNRLLNSYLASVQGLQADADANGSIASLLEAGKILAPYMPGRNLVVTVWRPVLDRLAEGASDEYRSVLKTYKQMIGGLPAAAKVVPVLASKPTMTVEAKPNKSTPSVGQIAKEQRSLRDQAAAAKHAQEIFGESFEIQENAVERYEVPIKEMPWMKEARTIALRRIVMQREGRGCYFAECIEDGDLKKRADLMSTDYIREIYTTFYNGLPAFTANPRAVILYTVFDNPRTIDPKTKKTGRG